MSVRKFARVKNRVESGAIQFGDDWPGLFLRGDCAKYLSLSIKQTLSNLPAGETLATMHLREVMETIENDVVQKPA